MHVDSLGSLHMRHRTGLLICCFLFAGAAMSGRAPEPGVSPPPAGAASARTASA
jgi:hypothetical protein